MDGTSLSIEKCLLPSPGSGMAVQAFGGAGWNGTGAPSCKCLGTLEALNLALFGILHIVESRLAQRGGWAVLHTLPWESILSYAQLPGSNSVGLNFSVNMLTVVLIIFKTRTMFSAFTRMEMNAGNEKGEISMAGE